MPGSATGNEKVALFFLKSYILWYMDKETTLQELKDIILKFKEDRDWGQFHDPKNLAEAISIEAAELLENFLWKDINGSKKINEDVEDELADVVIQCINFALAADIDIAGAVKKKIEKNAKKYPIDKAKGNAQKYTEL